MQKIKFDFEATKQLIYAPNSTAPIGAPVDADGNVANDGTAIGIVLCRRNESDKYWVKQNLVVMVAGYCDIIDAQNIWGDEYSAEAKSAMSDIVFCDEHKIGGGGGWPSDLPKPSVGGYGYSEEGIIIVSPLQNVVFDQGGTGLWMGHFDSPFEIVPGETYEVEYDGTAYYIDAEEYYGMVILGDFGEEDPDFNRYPFIIGSGGSETFVGGPDNGMHTIQIRKHGLLHHKIVQEYLPIATDEEYGVIKRDEIPIIYRFAGDRARWDQLVAAAENMRLTGAIIIWNGVPLIYAASAMGSKIFFRRSDCPATLYQLNAPANWTDYVSLRSADIAPADTQICRLFLSSEEDTSLTYSISVGADGDRRYIAFGSGVRIVDGRELHITSSTSGSNKKFKITVDDSGTISATEVTE